MQKIRLAEDGWNTCDPARVALAYSEDTRWRNRSEFLVGRSAAQSLLQRKWQRELEYRLIKELWAFEGSRIAVCFAYEWHDDSMNWYRSYGNENWEFHAAWPDDPPARQHQRSSDNASGAQIPLAAQTATGCPSGIECTRSVTAGAVRSGRRP